jgi:hypothetical protein
VYFGERLNAVGAAHWRAFAGQPYFDPQGAFFAAVVSGPLMLTLFTVLVCPGGGGWSGAAAELIGSRALGGGRRQ